MPDGDAGVVEPARAGAGYLHAPSLDQAKTAALLKSGHRARADEGEANPFDIDLSSARVRLARTLLDGVRGGQPLGDLLGYRFERVLHERRLAAHVPAFRAKYPANGGTLVDGHALIDALRAHAEKPGAPHWLPLDALPGGSHTRLQATGDELERALDSIDDAVLAESVFQTLRGNAERAGAALDALEDGRTPPPELESQRTPRRGRAVALGLFVPMQRREAASGRPRASAAPQLNAFCGAVIGRLGDVDVEVAWHPSDGGEPSLGRLGLDALGLDPIDLVYLAADEPGESSALEGLLRDHARRERPAGVAADARIELRPDARDGLPDGSVDLDTFLELARAVHQLVVGSRALVDEDLLPAGERSTARADVAELQERADAAIVRFDAAADELAALAAADVPDTARLHRTLHELAAFGLPGSVPRVAADASDAGDVLREQARAASALAATRRDARRTLERDAKAAPGAAERIALQQRRLESAFGESFRAPVEFRPSRAAELAASLAAADTLLDGDTDAPEQVLAEIAAVRPAAARARRLRDYAEALDPSRALPLAAAQLPHLDGSTRWEALPGAPRTAAGERSLALLALNATPWIAERPASGLFLDAWEELVPEGSHATGLAFESDSPNTEAPNAVLIATPADPGTPWSTDELLGTVRDLAETLPFRADEQGLRDLGHFLPAAYLAFNPDGATVSTDLAAYVPAPAD